ncbi:MAG TPA: glucokinase [Rudaea sp.]
MSEKDPRSIHRQALPAPFLAADVGGTHARVALASPEADGARPIRLLKHQKYTCADFPDLSAILRDFIEGLDGVKIAGGAIACAGYCLDGVIINISLPWTVSLNAIRADLGLSSLEFVNDFEAAAYATRYLGAGETTPLTVVRGPTDGLPALVVGPGTGLGAAVRIPSGNGTIVLATEAGQSAFAPSSEREIEILRFLRRSATHVSIESLLSGPGLVNIYTALSAIHGSAPALSAPAAITHAARAGTDAIARETLNVFCGLMGSVIGDLVLLYGAQGGVYLAGGVLPQIKDFMLGSAFVERFLDKGQMRPVLERVYVALVEQSHFGVLGAAGWYLERGRKE